MTDLLLALADGDDFLVPTNPDRVEPELPDRPKEACVPSILPYGWTARAQAEFGSLKARGAAMARARGAAAAQEGTDLCGRPEQISYRPFRRFNRELLGVHSTGEPQVCRTLERIANVLLGIRTDSLAEHPCWNELPRTNHLDDLVAERPWWLELQAMNRAFITGILRARDPGADQLCSRICRISNGQPIGWETADIGESSGEQVREDELNVLLHLLGIDDFPISSGSEGGDGPLPDYEDDVIEEENVDGMTEEDFDDLFEDHDWDAPTSQESGQLFDPVETMLQNESVSQDSTEPQEEAGPLAEVEGETEVEPIDANQQRRAHVSAPFQPSLDDVCDGSSEAGPARKRRKRDIILTSSPPTRSSPPAKSDTLTSSRASINCGNTSSSSSSGSSDSNNTYTYGPHCKCKCKSAQDSCDDHGRKYIIDAVAAARGAFRDDLAEALHDAREDSRADFAEAFYQIRETHHTDIAEALNEAHESHSDTIAQALNIIRDNFIPEIIRGVEEVVNQDFRAGLVDDFEERMGEQFNSHLGKLRTEALRYRRRERKLLDDAVNAVQRGEHKIGKLHTRARAVYENAALARDLENELAPENEDHLDELPPTEEEKERNVIVQGRLRRFGLENPQRIQYTIEQRIGEEIKDFALIDNVAVHVAGLVRRWAEAHGEHLPVGYISHTVRRREEAVREIMHQGLIRFGSEIAGELLRDERLFNAGRYEAIEVPEDFGDDEDDDNDDDDDNPPYGNLGPKPPGDDDDDDDDDDPPYVPRPPDPELFISPEEYEQALEEYNNEHGASGSSQNRTSSQPESSRPAGSSSMQQRRPTPADRRSTQAGRRATQAARRAKRPAHTRSRGGEYESEALARTFCDIEGCRAPLQMPTRPCGHRCGKTGHVICIARKYNGAENWDCEPCLLNREWGKVPRMWMLDQKFAEEDRRSAAAAGLPFDDGTRLHDEGKAGVKTSSPAPPPPDVTKPLPSSPPSKRKAPPARTRSTAGLNTRAVLEAELRRVKGLKAICDIAACPGLDYAPTHECDQDCGKLAHTPCMAMTNQGPDWRCDKCELLVREKRRKEDEALRVRAKSFAKDHAETTGSETRVSRRDRNLGVEQRPKQSGSLPASQYPHDLTEPTRSSAAKAKRAAIEADIAQTKKAKKPVSVECDAPGCRRFDYAPTHECDQDCGKIAHTICMGRYSAGSSWTCPPCQNKIDKEYREAREAEEAQWERDFADDDPDDPRPGPPILKGRFLDQLKMLDAWLARRKERLARESQNTEKDGAREESAEASMGMKRKAQQVSSPPTSLPPSPPSRPQTPPPRTRSLKALARLHALENEMLRAELANTPIISITCDIPSCSGLSYAPTHECDKDCGKLGHTTCMARASKGSQWRCEECDAPIREKAKGDFEESMKCCEFQDEKDHPVFSPYVGSGFPWHHLRRHEEYLQRKRREKGVPDPGDEEDGAAEFYAVRRRKAALGRERPEGGQQKRKRGVTTLGDLIKARSISGDAKRKGRTTTVRELLAANSKRKAARSSSPPPSKRNRNSHNATTGTSRPARRRNTSTIVHAPSLPPAPPPKIHIRCDVPGCESQYAPPRQACEARCGKRAHETCVQYFYHASKWLCPGCSLTEHGMDDRGEKYRESPPGAAPDADEEEEEAASASPIRLSIPSTIEEVDEDTDAEVDEPKARSPPKPTASPPARDANKLSPFSASLESSAAEQSLAGLEVCPIPMCQGFKSKPSRACGGGCGKKGHPACVRRFYEGATWKCIVCRNEGSVLLGKRKVGEAEFGGEGEGDDGKEDAELSEPRRSKRLRVKKYI